MADEEGPGGPMGLQGEEHHREVEEEGLEMDQDGPQVRLASRASHNSRCINNRMTTTSMRTNTEGAPESPGSKKLTQLNQWSLP